MRPRERKQRDRVLWTLCCLLWLPVLFLALELYARLGHRRGLAASQPHGATTKMRAVCEAFHPDLWETPWKIYQANASVEFSTGTATYQASINSWGFRGSEFEHDPSSDVIIACLGGSTTVNGPTDDTTYPALIEQYLNSDGTAVRTINCGVAGLKSEDYWIPLGMLLPHVRPDIVVEYNAVNDLCWHLFPLWKSRLNILQKWLLRSYAIQYFCGALFLPNHDTIREDIREYTVKNLKGTAAWLELRGARLYVCSFICPDPDELTRDEYLCLDVTLRHWWQAEYISYKKFYEIAGMYNAEIQTAFQGTDESYLAVAETGVFTSADFVDLCHLNSSGIRKKARVLATLLAPAVKRNR